MTPAAAAAAIADVQSYRQGLTARAAGTIWMVWGLALAAIAAAEMGAAAQFLEGPPSGEGFSVEWGAMFPALVGFVAFIGAVVASNAIWKSHAIQNEETHRPWVAWVAAAGIVAAFEVIGLTVLFLLAGNATVDSPDTTYIFITPLFSAGIAAALTFMLRRRTPVLPGILASVALELVLVASLLFEGSIQDQVVNAASLHAVTAIVACGGVGLYLFRRG